VLFRSIEKLGILHALSTDGKALVQSAVDIAGGRRAVKGMQQRIKVDKNLSKEEVVNMKARIVTLEAALDAQTAVLNNTIAESTTLNAVDKVALKENSQYIKTLEGHSAELYHVNNSIERHMKNITRLTSEKGQEAAAKTLRDQINASIAHLDAEEAKKKEERTTRGGAKPGGLSGFQLEKAITEGAIEESKLNVDEKTRLENHRNGLPDDSSLNEETGEVSPVITIKNVAEKVSEGTELSEEEYTFWEENEEAIARRKVRKTRNVSREDATEDKKDEFAEDENERELEGEEAHFARKIAKRKRKQFDFGIVRKEAKRMQSLKRERERKRKKQ
jgi:hypothetical protein